MQLAPHNLVHSVLWKLLMSACCVPGPKAHGNGNQKRLKAIFG
ncbi:hypothetical protein [Paraburkholderia sp. BL10I2N1]|nr:hypothetical protein [Paraburkholderia sp. BL10I2N1]TDN63991.1 hypothetical protein B0G77_7688 [Paraburkholderia sp. BL10I2N1]